MTTHAIRSSTPRRRRPANIVALAVTATLLAGARPSPAAAALAGGPDLSSAEARLASRFAIRGLPYPPPTATMIALKAEGRLELWAGYDGSRSALVRSYLVRATSGRLGPKLRQGDHQVPEGIYRVSALNPRSLFHLSLRLDYPNEADRARALEDGRTVLGGDIMIHGGRASDGCLPVGDAEIEELFALAERIGVENLAVVISPMDLRRGDPLTAVGRAAVRPRWLAQRYREIAAALQAFPLPADREDLPSTGELQAARAPECRPYDAADCERRCAAGDAASCARAGVLYADGRGVAPDPTKAWALLRDACGRGDAGGCAALGERLLADDGMRRDLGRAAGLARAACRAGDGHGCAQLAQLCTEKLIYPTDVPEGCGKREVTRLRELAVRRLSSSCRGWAAYDCFRLATIYAPGDLATALRFASASCQAGDAGGCHELGVIHELRGDPAGAADLYARACDAGYARACARLRTAGTTASAGNAG